MDGPPGCVKVVLLGETSVGKSCMALRFCENRFSSNKRASIGASFLSKAVYVEGRKILVNVWDTAGTERFHSLAPAYYRGAHAAIIVYDVTDNNSFSKAKMWVREIKDINSPRPYLILVGNKVDLQAQIQVKSETARTFSKDIHGIFYESSAKTGFNIENIFVKAAAEASLLRRQEDMLGMSLDNYEPAKKDQNCVCQRL